MIVMAYKAYLLLKADVFTSRHLAAMSSGAAIFLIIALFSRFGNDHVLWAALFSCAFLGLYAVSLNLTEVKWRSGFKITLLVLILMELSLTSYISVVQTGSATSREDYPWSYDSVQRVLGRRRPALNDFYRTEFIARWMRNDAVLYRTDGISLHSSIVDASAAGFMRGIGLPASGRGDYYGYVETSPLTNAFLNIRYLASRSGTPAEDEIYGEYVASAGTGSLLIENNHHLPLGFMVKAEVAEYVSDKSNPFNSQNDLFRRATGFDKDIFTMLEKTGTSGADYELPADGELYVFFNMDRTDNIVILENGRPLRSVPIDHREPPLLRVGAFTEGDTISFRSGSGADMDSMQVHVGMLNRELFERGYEMLADTTLSLVRFTDTRIVGRITVQEDGLLYTSIPHSGLWRAYVNDSEAEIVKVDGAMSAVWLSEGRHTVDFRLHNGYFTTGILISAAAFALFTIMIVFFIQRKRALLKSSQKEETHPEVWEGLYFPGDDLP